MTDTSPEFLTVKELAALLRIKERKVYDLAASGEVPCSRATGKLLFPEAEIRDWIAGASSGTTTPGPDRPAVFLGSHDPVLDWALRQSQCGLATYLDGSLDGLSRFRSGAGIAAGVHIHDADTDEWNIPRVSKLFSGRDVALIGFARRQRGLVLAPDLVGKIGKPADLIGHAFAARQAESGTERLWGDLLDAAGLKPGDIPVAETTRSEMDAVLAVASGTAAATFGLEPLARQFSLGFVPVIEERFDLLVDRKAYFDPPMQAFLAFCHSPAFAAKAKAMPGYDIADLGAVRWNG
ncbi:helix-turn-helix transcriptional regulator [Roseovarius aestuariivivens]|uniref:helix-turn-helix transcriptional regulator n=1 Tax=Roseovarius aestuariivivens TaxID=1888910 RepID=UPI00108196AC|nr:helix-turn-helix transcriptional regulator [Roseovarius aestuariivivens]